MAAKLPSSLNTIFRYVDASKDNYIRDLADMVAIKSVQGRFDDILTLLRRIESRLRDLGARTEMVDCRLPGGDASTQNVPPVLLATLSAGPGAACICLHLRVDVPDGGNYQLSQRDSRLFGSGTWSDKAQLACWLHVLEAHAYKRLPLPVTLKFIIEGGGETADAVERLRSLLYGKKTTFLKEVRLLVLCLGAWPRPAVVYGLRGAAHLKLEVVGSKSDLHSGHFGGTVVEAASDLVAILSSLEEDPPCSEDVCPVRPEEERIYEDIQFNVERYRKLLGVTRLLHEEKKEQIMMHRWRYPAMTVEAVEGGWCPLTVTAIPRLATANFTLWLVPEQDPVKVLKKTQNRIEQLLTSRGSCNHARVSFDQRHDPHSPWTADPQSTAYWCVRKALRTVHKKEPELVRRGEPNPRIPLLEAATGKQVVLFPLWLELDPVEKPPEESIAVPSYIDGTKVLAALLYEFGQSAEKL